MPQQLGAGEMKSEMIASTDSAETGEYEGGVRNGLVTVAMLAEEAANDCQQRAKGRALH
jgi:hypothetical protein